MTGLRTVTHPLAAQNGDPEQILRPFLELLHEATGMRAQLDQYIDVLRFIIVHASTYPDVEELHRVTVELLERNIFQNLKEAPVVE